MKKTEYKIIKSMIVLALIGLFAAFALPAMAQSVTQIPFLTGYNLQVTATSTNTYGATNGYAKGYTVTNSATYPYVSGFSPTYVTNAYGFADVPLWANRDGTIPLASISAQIVGINASFTNTATFRFAAVPVELRSADYPTGLFQPATQTQNLFSFTLTGNGTNPVVIATNLPTAVFQGSRAIRLTAIEWTNAGTNGTVAGVFLNGYKPD